MKFRKKPVVIEAEQFDPTGTGVEGAKLALHLDGCTGWHMDDNGNIVIPTLEGNMIATPGDWIIKGVQGEFYSRKPGIFKQTYEAVE